MFHLRMLSSTAVARKAYRAINLIYSLQESCFLGRLRQCSSGPGAVSLPMKSYSVTATGTLSTCETHTDTGFVIRSDTPQKMGGANSAPQPVELLLASLLGCEQATAMFVARHMKPRLHIDRIDFILHAERDPLGAINLPLSTRSLVEPPPARLASITGSATVYLKAGTGAAHTQADIDLLERQVQQRCPVANMVLLSGCTLHVPWTLASEEHGRERAVSSATAGAAGAAGGGGGRGRGGEGERKKAAVGARHFSSSAAAAARNASVPPPAPPVQHCWRCGLALHSAGAGTGTETGAEYALFCTSDMHVGPVLQPLREQNIDYFSLFQLPRTNFLVDPAALEQTYKSLQKLNHPDKYAASQHDALPVAGLLQGMGQVQSEQAISAENSSYINQAYQTLRSPIGRAAYMLQTYWGSNILSEESGTHKDAALALEIFELREELAALFEDITNSNSSDGGNGNAALSEFRERMIEEQATLMQEFQDRVGKGKGKGKGTEGAGAGEGAHELTMQADVEKLASCAVKLKYVTKILEEVDGV